MCSARWCAGVVACCLVLHSVASAQVSVSNAQTSLTDTQAWQQIDALLSMVVHYPRQSDTSGLVEQQAWFHGRHRK